MNPDDDHGSTPDYWDAYLTAHGNDAATVDFDNLPDDFIPDDDWQQVDADLILVDSSSWLDAVLYGTEDDDLVLPPSAITDPYSL